MTRDECQIIPRARIPGVVLQNTSGVSSVDNLDAVSSSNQGLPVFLLRDSGHTLTQSILLSLSGLRSVEEGSSNRILSVIVL